MTPVEEFYQQIQAEADAAAVIVNKRGRKVSDKQYFTISTEIQLNWKMFSAWVWLYCKLSD